MLNLFLLHIPGKCRFLIYYLVIFSFSELELPNYENQSMLREKLKMAISEGKEGFYII